MSSFDLRRLRLRSGEEHRVEVPVELEPLEFGGVRYVSVPEEVPADLRLIRASTGTVFELRFRSRLHGPCQRCLGDAVLERTVSAREYQATSPGDDDELRNDYLKDDLLDLTGWARDALVLALPHQILCRPDCAGLCPVCGKDLNLEPHEHEVNEPDSRWSPLAELRDRL